MAVPPSRQWPRGPINGLHCAANHGSTERIVALLAQGVIDIDQGTPTGYTPLMLATASDHPRAVRILLNKGADISVVNNDGFTALYESATRGHLDVTKLLVTAGADLEAKTSTTGSTPLHAAVEAGHLGVTRVLIEAGANPNSRRLDGATPLYRAAWAGRMDAVKVLLRAKANPLFPLLAYSHPSGTTFVPLDAAAENGHSEVVETLIQEHEIGGCGGAGGGVTALEMAAMNQHMEVMGLPTSAGVVDTGRALLAAAAACGQELPMKFLLQHQERKASGEGAGYLDIPSRFGITPLAFSIQACHSPRIIRLLVDAGADTVTAVRLLNEEGVLAFDDTPLALAELLLRVKTVGGKEATEEQLHSLEAARRLLFRVEAVHAVSWLWASDVPSVTYAAARGAAGKTKATPTPLMLMLPILRRRARRPRLLLAALFRNSKKP